MKNKKGNLKLQTIDLYQIIGLKEKEENEKTLNHLKITQKKKDIIKKDKEDKEKNLKV